VEAADNRTVPVDEPAPEKYSAPALKTPVPANSSGSAIASAPTLNVAPLATVVLAAAVVVPRAFTCVMVSVPAFTAVTPENPVFDPPSERTPSPDFVRLFAPVIAPP
jgi:hypothetical protein